MAGLAMDASAAASSAAGTARSTKYTRGNGSGTETRPRCNTYFTFAAASGRAVAPGLLRRCTRRWELTPRLSRSDSDPSVEKTSCSASRL